MKTEVTIEPFLSVGYREIDLTVDCDVGFNGIGWYKYGSQRCFDKGEPTLDVNEVTFDKAPWCDNDVELIEEYIEEHKQEIEDKIWDAINSEHY